ncbi:GRIP1-associated protein 1-like isoform X2 [Amphiura filiformis]|uniref:GRIP1-associated protein 1-like isoform X2 n=1 Tax=Amphiura filiformis TaxID=82378 RepID=UPI003B21431C
MAQALSEEEFQRMQAQLLELRTSNYSLVDQCKKLKNEVTTLKEKADNYEKDLQKANKTISKSKKAREVEALIAENDSLQRKLHSQEEDFRLQNSTLMAELSKLCTTNENLEKEVDKLKAGQGSNEVKAEDGELQAELRRLQAVNAALQKNVTSIQEKYEEELVSLKNNIHTLTETNNELEGRCFQLLGERPSPTGAAGDGDMSSENRQVTAPVDKEDDDEDMVEMELNKLLNTEFEAFIEDLKLSAVTSDFDDDIEPKDPVTVLQGHAKQLKTRLSGVLVRNMESLVKLMSQDEEEPPGSPTSPVSSAPEVQLPSEPQGTKVETADVKKLSEMQLQIDTEKEENRLMKEQLQQAKNAHTAEITSLKEEIAKLTEKAKKKQESLLQLQNEKEQLYTDSRRQYDDLQVCSEKEVVDLRAEKTKLLEELTKTKHTLAIQQDQSFHKLEQLEKTVSSLSSQTMSSEQVASIEAENSSLKHELEKIKQAYSATIDELNQLRVNFATVQSQLEQLQVNYKKISAEKEDIRGQLGECLNASTRLGEELQGVQNDRDNLHRDLGEATKLAENRKTMLDDMAIQTQTIKQNHTDEVNRLKEGHQKEADELREQLKDEQSKRKVLEPLQEKVTELEEKVQSLDNSRGWFERRLEETEQQRKEAEENHEQTVSELKTEHEEQIQVLKDDLAEKELKFAQANESSDRHLDSIAKLRQEIKDGLENRKLSEKKGLTMVKDLKRQLKQERKRADKLQEKISEVLSQHSQGKPGMDELFQNTLSENRQKLETSSSVSSWSASGTREYAGSDQGQSPDGSMNIPSVSLSEETTELIARLTELQQEKWSLEEKVRHLEESNSCMADDLLKKSAIIEAHVMERKLIDPSKSAPPVDKKTALRNKIVDFVKNDDSEISQKEMNQKLQVMLEETLTKNMHLQKDIEMLSEEVVRLSKLVPLSGAGTPTTDLPPHTAAMKTTSSTEAAMAGALATAATPSDLTNAESAVKEES